MTFCLNNIICTIRNTLNSIYTTKYILGFENKLIVYINHLLQIITSGICKTKHFLSENIIHVIILIE